MFTSALHAWVQRVFDIEYLFVREVNGENEVVSSGSTVMVAYNYASNKTIEILPEWRKKIEEFEK